MKLNEMRKLIPSYYRVMDSLPEELRDHGDAFFEDSESITVEWSSRKVDSRTLELKIGVDLSCEWWMPGEGNYGDFNLSECESNSLPSELVGLIRQLCHCDKKGVGSNEG